jgi:GT2 family glycosyltransferase
MRNLLTTVLVTYNNVLDLQHAIQSLSREPDHRIIVVDNCSGDEDKSRLTELISDRLEVIWNSENVGFPAACNQAVEMVSTPYIAFVNCDTEWRRPILSSLLGTLRLHENVAGVQPIILTSSGQIDSAGAFHTPLGFLYLWQHQKKWPYRSNVPFETHAIHGAFMIWRASAYRELGGMDGRFFLYFEESDLCHKALNSGYSLLVDPNVLVKHIGGTSTSATRLNSERLGFRNRMRSLTCRLPMRQLLLILPAHITSVSVYCVLASFRSPKRAINLLAGLTSGLFLGISERRGEEKVPLKLEYPSIKYFWAQAQMSLRTHDYAMPKLVRQSWDREEKKC